MSTMNRIYACFLALVVAGCAETVRESYGPEIEVVEWKYNFSVDIENSSKKAKQKAWNEIDEYVTRNWSLFSTQTIRLYWTSQSGEILANDYKKYLLSKGLASQKVMVLKGNETLVEGFDVMLATQEYRAVTPVCGYEKIGNYGELPHRCYTDGARWKSMVHPERMLSGVK